VNAPHPVAVTGFCSGAYEKIMNAVFCASQPREGLSTRRGEQGLVETAAEGPWHHVKRLRRCLTVAVAGCRSVALRRDFGNRHQCRHYGLFASADRAANIERARQLLAAPSRSKDPETPNATATDEQHILPRPCPCCGGRMIIIETFERRCEPKYRPTPTPVTIRIDSS
jgi:hypothetical protein